MNPSSRTISADRVVYVIRRSARACFSTLRFTINNSTTDISQDLSLDDSERKS